jgi:hypothetical protein
MAKLLLISLLVGTVLIPIHLARDPRPRRGLRRVIRAMLTFVAGWGLACAYLYTRLQ